MKTDQQSTLQVLPNNNQYKNLKGIQIMMTENLYEMVNQQSEACPTEDMELNTPNNDCAKEFKNTKSQMVFTEMEEGEGTSDHTADESKDIVNIFCVVDDFEKYLQLNERYTKYTELHRYYDIGEAINAFYKGDVKNKDLQKLSNRTRIKKDILLKASKFAACYTRDHLSMLCGEYFVPSWQQISHNISMPPEELIEVYMNSSTPRMFDLNIKSFKSFKRKTRR